MPSSTSNSSSWRIEPPPVEAQYERPLPDLRYGIASIVALMVFAGAFAAWELHWRAYGSVPSIQNSDGLWSIQRRRIDHVARAMLLF